MSRILIVEDADSLRDVLQVVLKHQGNIVDAFPTAEEALEVIRQGKDYDCIISDFKLPKMNGIDFLREFRKISERTPFIIMTAFGSVEIAVEALKEGANDFICKPFEPQDFCDSIQQTIKHRQVIYRELGLESKRSRRFLTINNKAERILNDARKAAKVDSTVLILGESGVGKELLARFIHEHSDRKDKPFVAVNCAALPAELLESEFFGHVAGAFTGATQSRIGMFEYAAEGTIFLDEIGEMPASLQVKLLRALQEKEIKKVGSNDIVKVAPRVICATNVDVIKAVENKDLREDFYYRIAVIELKIPPLRERKDDIDLLVGRYMDHFAEVLGKEKPTIDNEALELLKQHSWPGNARELENVIERAMVLAKDTILVEHLGLNLNLDFEAIQDAALTLPEIAGKASREAEFSAIVKALEYTRGNKSRAAKLLGVSYKTLLNKVKEYDIEGLEALNSA
ncbi:MAG: sigma-54-dependent Fis family transcriptional regulator [Bdellovibrionales bacterium]|nr:sigma-54-dependent Fis family transcriptional regulator [Bdellovibrionales bacterium]